MCLQVCFAAGGLVCSSVCECCKVTLGSFKQQVRLSYLIQLILCVFLIFLISWIRPLLELFDAFGFNCPQDACIGISVIYRMSFSLAICHSIILLCLLCRNDFSRIMNEQCWASKVLVVIGAFVGSMFIKNEFFEVYSTIAKVFSIFFLLFQIIMIIDLCYLWNESWVGNYDRGQDVYAWLLIIFTLALYIGVIVTTVFLYKWFAGCGIGTMAITANVILMLIATGLPFTGLNPNGSIFASSAVCAYTTYFTYAGLSNMIDTCNPVGDSSAGPIIFLVTGSILVIVSLLYVTFGDSQNSSGNTTIAPNTDIAKGVLEDSRDNDVEYEEDLEDERKQEQKRNINLRNKDENTGEYKDIKHDEREEEPAGGKLSDYTRSNGYIYFHVIMLCTAFYMAMLLTNWGSADANGAANDPTAKGQSFSFDKKSNESQWFMIVTAWTTSILYIWTIFAPYFCSERDFS